MNKELDALECLEYIGKTCYVEAGDAEEDCLLYAKDYGGYNTVKDCILKAQKENKALETIREKCVGNDNLLLVKESIYYKDLSYKYYLGKAELGIDNIVNINLKEKDLLTEEEFDLLKEVLE